MATTDPEGSDDDDDNRGITSILTVDDMIITGLSLGGYTKQRIERAKGSTNIERYKSLYGSSPHVCAMIWEDLQTTSLPNAHVLRRDRKVKWFLIALHHLKRYPTEIKREGMFNILAMWGRDLVWYFVEKVQGLKAGKIVWPDNFGGGIWVLTVDGTHCWIQEPQHRTWSQDSRYYSHKYGKAGLNYELGISLSESKLIWMNGPFVAGGNDKSVLKKQRSKGQVRGQR